MEVNVPFQSIPGPTSGPIAMFAVPRQGVPGAAASDGTSATPRQEASAPAATAALPSTDERPEGRGSLKIFLGAAPGVGKTYAMLEAARARQGEGVDVVAARVDTHGQPDTETLLEGIEALPCRVVEQSGQRHLELDLEGVLARRPQLALVDDLEHLNVQGSRHPKRYHDVQELLDAGIDVYTTVNVWHLESLNDVITQITGLKVRETIPDWLLERADEIELVDLAPQSLLQRLREGKVHLGGLDERAARRLFRPGNLSALRELALRHTAERVDRQMQSYMEEHDIIGPWPAAELIMVCVSESPLSPTLVRTARRMAARRHARWLAVHVDLSARRALSDAARERVSQTLRLAEQLGGEAITIPGDSVAGDIVRFARSRNVTQLIIGKSMRTRWDEFWQGSVVYDVIRASGKIDVHVVTGETDSPAELRRADGGQSRHRLQAALLTTLLVASVGLLAKALAAFVLLPNLSIVFLIAVLVSALRWGKGASIYAAILSVLVYDFLLVEPLHTFTINSPQDVLALVAFLAVAVLTSDLAVRVRSQAESARLREGRTASLYALSQQLARAADMEGILQTIALQVALVVDAEAAVFLPDGDDLCLRASSQPGLPVSAGELAAARWAQQRGQPAGHGTDNLPGAEWCYLPLPTAHGAVGVLAAKAERWSSGIAPDERQLLESLAGQSAVAIERAVLAQDMAQSKVLAETERLRAALFSSISHDLRTPLSSVIGATTSLLSFGAGYDEEGRRELLQTILEEAERLDHYVANLLDMTRLEAGALRLRRDWADVKDVIGSALNRMGKRLQDHQVRVEVEPGLPLLAVDFVLMEQVMVNLLENAAKYSAPHSTVRVTARHEESAVVIDTEDEGIGIPEEELERVFDKFYRVQRGDAQSGGSGLGLSICRGIVEAHGGRISAHRRTDGAGTRITVRLPVGEASASGIAVGR